MSTGQGQVDYMNGRQKKKLKSDGNHGVLSSTFGVLSSTFMFFFFFGYVCYVSKSGNNSIVIEIGVFDITFLVLVTEIAV